MPSILVTGAAKGLGREIARFFHANQWALYLVVRSTESKTDLLNEFNESQILISDVTDEKHEVRLSEWLNGKVVDVLVNNAGSGSKGPSIETATSEQIRNVFEINCIGVFSTVKGALPSLERSDRGLVLNISSRKGSLAMQASGVAKGGGCSYSYRISKAAQNMLTLCLADDLEDKGISVAAVHPGRLLTKMASKDACMTPQDSARKIGRLIVSNQVESRDYLCMETGSLQW